MEMKTDGWRMIKFSYLGESFLRWKRSSSTKLMVIFTQDVTFVCFSLHRKYSKNLKSFLRDRWHITETPLFDRNMRRFVFSRVGSCECRRGDRGSSVTRGRSSCAVTQMNTAVVGEKVSGFCWYSVAVHFLAGHLTAQWALKLEMMLVPLARRRWLPCHPAYAGRHKSYGVNKDPPHSTTARSSCVLIFPVNTIPFSFIRPLIFLVCVSVWVFLQWNSGKQKGGSSRTSTAFLILLLFLVP